MLLLHSICMAKFRKKSFINEKKKFFATHISFIWIQSTFIRLNHFPFEFSRPKKWPKFENICYLTQTCIVKMQTIFLCVWLCKKSSLMMHFFNGNKIKLIPEQMIWGKKRIVFVLLWMIKKLQKGLKSQKWDNFFPVNFAYKLFLVFIFSFQVFSDTCQTFYIIASHEY